MNIQKHRDLVREKLGNEKEFIMGLFFSGVSSLREDDKVLDVGEAILRGREISDCGTACCIAGTAICYLPEEAALLAKKFMGEKTFVEKDHPWHSSPMLFRTDRSDKSAISLVASKLLGIPESAFYADEWPGGFRIEIDELCEEEDVFDFDGLPHETRKEIGLRVLDWYYANYPVQEVE